MAGVDLALRAEVAERQHAVFDGANPVQSPLGVNDGLGVLALGEGFGGEIDEKFGGELLVSGEVFGGQNDNAGGGRGAERSDWRSSSRFRYEALYFAGRCGGWLPSGRRLTVRTWNGSPFLRDRLARQWARAAPSTSAQGALRKAIRLAALPFLIGVEHTSARNMAGEAGMLLRTRR